MSNPLLEVGRHPGARGAWRTSAALTLVVDNTFSPMILSPLRLGADVVVHSMTKFINGTSDCVAGCVVSAHDFIRASTTSTAAPACCSARCSTACRAASILKNLHSLHIRMRQHSANAHALRAAARRAADSGCTTPGSSGTRSTS